jgi:ABC-type multidrug transport system permease subunit
MKTDKTKSIKFPFLQTAKGCIIVVSIIVGVVLAAFVVFFLTIVIAIYGGLGIYGFAGMFFANPNVSDFGCYMFNRTLINPANILNLSTPCGYPNASTILKI